MNRAKWAINPLTLQEFIVENSMSNYLNKKVRLITEILTIGLFKEEILKTGLEKSTFSKNI
jgi:hypothetical protein